MLLLIFLNLFLLTTALPSPYQYIGCISTASAPPFTPSPIKAPFTAPECLKSCSYTATLIAIGSDSCLCDAGGASASFELVDEARCNAPCTDGGKCGGEGVLSLYQLSSGSGGGFKARNGTIPPVVPPCNVCDGVKTPVPTPTQTQVVATSVICPPEGCTTVIPIPVTTPAGNSTGKPCPSGGCNGNNGGGSHNGSSSGSGSSGKGSNAAPDLASDSPKLLAPTILSAIAAVIFGVCLI
ncbi:uncharacterized protein B0J16DRAFT_411582 [Fusarium flagelliforme]|uniref:Wsc protein n=1 Tax=Fusarium flagelliforme TaxID=2675880 RepID=A0A395MHM5_9HYPO|nr:uncharacterized protein B0J16DRAFT_411582 [Fusarium flagelliforme]KAH7192939.1 hypothetical protein B0J16DRAFT_411582 [Fusarium flagelliforme]RFN47428.1 wsc protein [Fusarium flagelliforme]